MSLESVSTVTQTAYDQAEAAVIAILRFNAPNLDLRRGTVLRELIVRPVASFYALNAAQNVQQQLTASLNTLAANPALATPEAVDNILANFNITMQAGSVATGVVKVSVSSSQTYYIPSAFTLTTIDGLQFNVTQAWTVTPTPDSTLGNQLQLFAAADGLSFYFLLPMVANAVGTAYLIPAGTALDPTSSFDGYVSAAAYSTFTGGVDAETISTLIARLPAALSNRSLESRTSIEAMLRDPTLGNFDAILQALDVQGMGSGAQLRDKHNPWGTSVGARVDIYARNFVTPTVITLGKMGTLVAANTYQITIAPADAPGFYAVRSITDIEAIDTASVDPASLPSLGSYAFTDVRTADSVAVLAAGHDINLAENTAVEICGTAFQGAVLTVTGVPGTGASKQFKVELYSNPSLGAMQTYIDGLSVRSVKGDCLMRTPQICLVGVRANVVAAVGTALDLTAMTDALLAYINSRSFVSKLTASELLAVLHQYSILRVDMTQNTQTGFRMDGVVRDASGVVHTLTGNTLDISSIALPQALLTPDTCVFGSLAERINLTVSYE